MVRNLLALRYHHAEDCLRAISVPYIDSQDMPETYYPPRLIESPVHRKPLQGVVVMPGKGTSGSAHLT